MPGLSKRIMELDQALADLGDHTMTLSQFDGLFAGLVVCPELIPPSEWLGMIWAVEDGDEPVFEDTGQLQAITRLLMAHYNDVADTLRRRPGRYAPIFDFYEPTDETFWEFWIEGFEMAMSLRPEAWLPLAEEPGDAGEALAMLVTLAGLASRDPEYQLPDALGEDAAKEFMETAPEVVPACVLILAARRYGAVPKPGGKVGRNDPCPCESGKKYKKCCGAH